ncbi:MAG: ATP-dependent RNA helicase, partial [Polyangiaceae bacterium]|nr:ATP-dependent RNA helicase [Polyangiaceae bacterium]
MPIDARLPEALGLIERHRRLVLVAEPGAGKTTRLPRAILEDPRFGTGEILVLEPRRLAARLSAARVAAELGEKVGERVGYAVRFERRVSSRTRVIFLTEALLTRRLVADPLLEGVSAVVFDEFHERSLHADLGLALARRAQQQRPELALVVMSATLDARALTSYLDAPLLEVEGRAHPVAVDYLDKPDDRPLEAQVASAVRRLLREDVGEGRAGATPSVVGEGRAGATPSVVGDILVFLPGAGEIRRAEEACRADAARLGLDVVLLHGDMPASEQDRALRGGDRRKVILATNVAETSITIPTVTAVIDSGLKREARHSPWSGLPSLVTAKVSQASATQRAGRAGRTGPGRCLRLYTRHDFSARPAHDDAEIKRADLAEALLFLAS